MGEVDLFSPQKCWPRYAEHRFDAPLCPSSLELFSISVNFRLGPFKVIQASMRILKQQTKHNTTPVTNDSTLELLNLKVLPQCGSYNWTLLSKQLISLCATAPGAGRCLVTRAWQESILSSTGWVQLCIDINAVQSWAAHPPSHSWRTNTKWRVFKPLLEG